MITSNTLKDIPQDRMKHVQELTNYAIKHKVDNIRYNKILRMPFIVVNGSTVMVYTSKSGRVRRLSKSIVNRLSKTVTIPKLKAAHF